jgi:hypothetical protein
MESELEALEEQLRNRLSLEFRLEPIGDERLAVLTPFTFDDGDRFPIVLQKVNNTWEVTDDGGVVMHLSYLDIPFDEGNRARLVENITRRHDVTLTEDWTLMKSLGNVPDADALMTFIHAVTQVADLDFLAREVVESTFQEDFRSFLRQAVEPSRLTLDYFDAKLDPDQIYRADVAIGINGNRLFGFAVPNDVRAKDATITLLTYERWYGAVDSFVVFEDQTELPRVPLAQLSNVVGKQFAALAGQEDRIREYFHRLKVPLVNEGARGEAL